MNQTTQLHQIAAKLPEIEASFSPYYGDTAIELMRRAGLLETTIGGNKLWERALSYLRAHGLRVDVAGKRGPYDLVVTSSDVVVPHNATRSRLVAVQEGILDPENLFWPLVRRFPRKVPRWLAGTAATGLSGIYDYFCVASEGYRRHFIARGAPADRVISTGMPNFDNLAVARDNGFPYRDYVLVCTSDSRETLKLENRRRIILDAVRLAAGRPLFFKLHPNENADRAEGEIRRWAPGALVFRDGDTNAMIANCSVLVTRYSTVAFVGLALGKEVHSYHPVAQLRELMPDQHGRAAENIAGVCRRLLFGAETQARSEDRSEDRSVACASLS